MTVFAAKDSRAAGLSLGFSILSFLACLIVVLSIVWYRKAKKSYHLMLVNRLLISDMGLSGCIIGYYIVQYPTTDYQLSQFCKVYLPVVIYFFVTGYLYTILIALRFQTIHVNESGHRWKPPFKMYYVWFFPLIFIIPMLVASFAVDGMTTVHENESDTNQTCTFNHETAVGEYVDLLCFQCPLFLTIVINCYFYTKGLLSLRNAPQSVLARQMRRAGGYLLVLLVVWVPNIVYNILTIFVGNNNSFADLLDLGLFLTSLQGALNVCVYVWSNGMMRKWLLNNLICFRIDRSRINSSLQMRPSNGNQTVSSGGDTFDNQSIDSSLVKQQQDNGDSDSDEDTAWMEDKQSFTGLAPPDLTLSNNKSNLTNPLLGGSGSSTNKTKSILIHSNSNRQINEARSIEVDEEKYVRFGENSTRIISVVRSYQSDSIRDFRPSVEIAHDANDANDEECGVSVTGSADSPTRSARIRSSF